MTAVMANLVTVGLFGLVVIFVTQIIIGVKTMAILDDLKAAADRASNDLATLKAKVVELAAQLAAIPVPVDNTPAIQAVVDELNTAAGAAEAP